ncbi:hypothetical protein ACFYM2_23455 [Streptomyces sp. NPDC006711]|uniref:hypothetical protein n=1 Tax=Streptomyces sp. NPDC006711 TaxID=3364762 RepID=UPI003680FC88
MEKDASGKKGPDMNMQQAADRADAMLDATFAAIQPEVQWSHTATTAGSCDVTRRRMVMTIISEQRRGSFLGLIERFWKQSGYVIKSVNPDKQMPVIYAQSRDGFAITVSVGDKGNVDFEVDTPCVQESKVAKPKSKANGPSYEDVWPLPLPNVHSDFWSTDTPIEPN